MMIQVKTMYLITLSIVVDFHCIIKLLDWIFLPSVNGEPGYEARRRYALCWWF